MSFFPSSFVNSHQQGSFTPLFRLLDDFDSYSSNGGRSGHLRNDLKTFQPKFDVKELPDAYELHGELPGIEQKDIEIEFTDRQTMTIRGRTERSYTSGNPPSSAIEAPKTSGTITEDGEQHETSDHKASVEDDIDENDKSTQNQEVSKSSSQVTKPAEQKPEEPKAKYWISERSVGQFSRSFSFPATVDQEQVKASMKNGILSIVVPKAKKYESRKISIN